MLLSPPVLSRSPSSGAQVSALAATGVADVKLGRKCEDTITLSTQWRNKEDQSAGTAVYTASWIAPKV